MTFSTLGIIIGCIVIIVLFIASIMFDRVSSIISTLISIAILVLTIIYKDKLTAAASAYSTGNADVLIITALICAAAYTVWLIYYGGPACFRESETYLILGTLIEVISRGSLNPATLILLIIGGAIGFGLLSALLIMWGGISMIVLSCVIILLSVIRTIRAFLY